MHRCRRCGIELTDATWSPSRQMAKNYLCRKCQNRANEPASKKYCENPNNRDHRLLMRKEWGKRTRINAVQLLGGKCQCCGSTTSLHLAHLVYTRKRGKGDSGLMTARQAIVAPSHFLLLCVNCHFHPEALLAELIWRRNNESSVS